MKRQYEGAIKMNDLSKSDVNLLFQKPPQGDSVRPTNPFIEFKKEETNAFTVWERQA